MHPQFLFAVDVVAASPFLLAPDRRFVPLRRGSPAFFLALLALHFHDSSRRSSSS